MQYENVLKVIGCSCYTCLPRTLLAAAQTAPRGRAPGTGPKAQRLLTIARQNKVQHIHVHASKGKKNKK